jgi:hypothetical protein
MTPEERADHDLASLRRWTQRLRQYAAEWDAHTLDERERQAFPLEWDNIIGRLAKVEALALRQVLRPSAVVELRHVADELAELLPTMQRLHLRQPDAGALERARTVQAA